MSLTRRATVGERLNDALAETLAAAGVLPADLADADVRLDRAVEAVCACFDIDTLGQPKGELIVARDGRRVLVDCTVHGRAAINLIDQGDGTATFICAVCGARQTETI